jgi:hypothetical protein
MLIKKYYYANKKIINIPVVYVAQPLCLIAISVKMANHFKCSVLCKCRGVGYQMSEAWNISYNSKRDKTQKKLEVLVRLG